MIDESKKLFPKFNILTSSKDLIDDSTNNNEPRMKLLMDNMNDDLARVFDGYPDRLFIVNNNKIVCKGRKGPLFVTMKPIEQFINHELKVI